MINYDLQKIRAIVFDLDGVLSKSTISLGIDGTPLRTVNIKDGYAIQMAVKMGLNIAIISGCRIEGVRKRYEGLGMTDIYLGAAVKIKVYEDFLARHGLKDEEVMFMGDDIPDYPLLQRAGVATCPADAAVEVKEIADYISIHPGGRGCVRDVIEQVLRLHGQWFHQDAVVW
jgi:3-deoxy-D-manno-octulosonate 8-phosphate phosphatase (KDO 8-P phosphatase)